MRIGLLRSFQFGRRLVSSIADLRATDVVNRISFLLLPDDRILDVGSGTCNVGYNLCKKGFQITFLDIANQSCVDGITPVIYDGKLIPYEDNSFTLACVLDVLHHTHNPDSLLCEASRVARRVVIMETVYKNEIEKNIVRLVDCLFNFEFFDYAGNHRSDREWRDTFTRLGLTMTEVRSHRFWVFFKAATYVVQRAE